MLVMAAECRLCGALASPCAELAQLGFARCNACSFVFLAQAAEIRTIYENGDYAASSRETFTEAFADRQREARVRLDWLAPLSAGSDLLDVGAASGAFVAEATARGYRAWGIEASPPFADHARTMLGVDVRTGMLEDAAIEPESLDVVTLWHVLEHLSEPMTNLSRIASALRPGGQVVIEVPNYASAFARRMGTSWPPLQPEVHTSQFTPKTLRLALRQAGFEPELIETMPFFQYLSPRKQLDPRHFVTRARNAFWIGSLRGRHPSGHELLRAVGRRTRRTTGPVHARRGYARSLHERDRPASRAV